MNVIKSLLLIILLYCCSITTAQGSINNTVTARKQWQIDLQFKLMEKKAAQRQNEQVKPEKLAPGQLSIGAFVKLPGVTNVQISPDGKHLSLVYRQEGEERLGLVDSTTLKLVGSYTVKGVGRAVGKVTWVNNERLVYSVTESGPWNRQVIDNGQLYAINVSGTVHRMILGKRGEKFQAIQSLRAVEREYGSHRIIDLLKDDPRHILITFYRWHRTGYVYQASDQAKPIIYKLNIYNGRKRKVDQLPLPLSWAITDHNGKVRFSVGVNDKNRQIISYRKPGSEQWQDWSLQNFEGKNARPLSFTEDNNSVYLLANVGYGTQALYRFGLNDKSIKKLVHNEQVDISKLIRDFSGRRIIGIGTELGLPQYQYIDLKDKKTILHRQLLATFEHSDVFITSSTVDGSKLIVFVYSDINPGEYYLFDTVNNKAKSLISTRGWIDPALMASTESLTIKTRDGALITGYLTTPKGADGALPMVVMPHGGPHGVRDTWGFDWEVQMLANRGYAVLQVNYRGSAGFGLLFEHQGKGQWGTLMQNDLTDATNAMVNRGVADKNRLCLFGTSYGGYAAMMGAVTAPDLYQCVIGSAGVYHLPMLFEQGDIATRKNGLLYLKAVLGENTEDLKKRSPVFNVDKIKSDVLLIHGAKDRLAPMAQAHALMQAFDKIDKPYQWLELSNEAHGYYGEVNRMTVYQTVLTFLDQHIGQSASK